MIESIRSVVRHKQAIIKLDETIKVASETKDERQDALRTELERLLTISRGEPVLAREAGVLYLIYDDKHEGIKIITPEIVQL